MFPFISFTLTATNPLLLVSLLDIFYSAESTIGARIHSRTWSYQEASPVVGSISRAREGALETVV